MYMRDEYAASQKRGFGCGLWTMWTVAVALGAFLGQAAGQVIVKTLLPGEEPSAFILIPVLVLAGAVMGTVIGLTQGLVLLRFIKLAGYREWVLASALGGALRWSLAGSVGIYLLQNLNTGITVCNPLITLIVFGVLSGAIFGLPQALVLRRRLGEMSALDRWAWVLANAGGGILTMPFIMLSGLTASALRAMAGIFADEYMWRAVIAVTVTWIVTGLTTGLPLIDRLKYSPQVDPSAAMLLEEQSH